jgi:hypothetical protein
MITINWHPSPREMRQWAGLLAVALGLVGSLFYFLEWGIFRGGEGLAKFLWVFGAVAFLTGATGSRAGLPAYWAWMGFVYAVSWAIGHVALASVYFLVVTPLAVVARLIGRDRLQIRSAARTSYWHRLDVAPSHHPERQF